MDKTLVEMLHISNLEIADRLKILNLTPEELDLLSGYKPIVEACAETVVEQFYEVQATHDEVTLLIGDAETMRRLRNALRRYVVELFSGYYDHEYVNNRLRIGLVHKRIGVEPKFYLAGMLTLKSVLTETLASHETDSERLQKSLLALDKLLHFDTTLVFDTYIHTVVTEVENVKKRAILYANELEEKNKLLGTYAERDSLTDILNIRGMQKILRREIAMAQRRKSVLSVIYIDVDDFKQVNDTKGHAKGDEILVDLAKCITENMRSADYACRIGGDEFCVILPDCDLAGAFAIADLIQDAFSQRYPNNTISIGVSETGHQEYKDETRLLHEADEKMYADKSAKKEQKSAAAQDAAE